MNPLSQREQVAAEIERQTLIAEARMMVDRLGVLMNFMGAWAEEDMDDDVA